MKPRYDAVLFDLLTALLDSWSLWNAAAGSAELGARWRQRYLELTYRAGSYRPYEAIVAEAAEQEALGQAPVQALTASWDELRPWPDVPETLARLSERVRLGVVTNCSEELGHRRSARHAIGDRASVF